MEKYFRSVRSLLSISIISDGLVTASSAFLVYIQKMLFDSLASGGEIDLSKYMIALLISIGSIIFFSYITMIFMIKSRVTVGRKMREDFFSAITKYDNKRFNSKSVGEYVSVQGNDIKALSNSYLNSVADLVKSIIMFFVYGVVMFVFINQKVAIIILILSLFSALIVPKITKKRLSKKHRDYLRDTGECNSKTMDLLNGFTLINSNTRDKFNEIFNKYINRNAKVELVFRRIYSLASVLSSMSTYIINGVAVIVAISMIYSGEITIGSAVASIGFINLFAEAIGIFIYASNGSKSHKEIKSKLMEMLNVEPLNLVEKTQFDSAIEFMNVSIDYDDFSIKNISYRFNKGKKYAIVGGSGSGKSSLVKALVKEIQTNHGQILIDNQDISKLDVSPIISYVSQDEHIYADNFHNNVTCFDSYCSNRLPYITQILEKDFLGMIKNNENSSTLSGGQKGCIKFFRSYLDDKEICIYDEVFAAMDNETMTRFKDYVLKSDKTIIVITHKLSDDLTGFDDVIVLDKGKMLAQ